MIRYISVWRSAYICFIQEMATIETQKESISIERDCDQMEFNGYQIRNLTIANENQFSNGFTIT